MSVRLMQVPRMQLGSDSTAVQAGCEANSAAANEPDISGRILPFCRGGDGLQDGQPDRTCLCNKQRSPSLSYEAKISRRSAKNGCLQKNVQLGLTLQRTSLQCSKRRGGIRKGPSCLWRYIIQHKQPLQVFGHEAFRQGQREAPVRECPLFSKSCGTVLGRELHSRRSYLSWPTIGHCCFWPPAAESPCATNCQRTCCSAVYWAGQSTAEQSGASTAMLNFVIVPAALCVTIAKAAGGGFHACGLPAGLPYVRPTRTPPGLLALWLEK